MDTSRARETAVVLGGTGFLGRRVAQTLREQGYVVRIGTRFPSKIADLGGDPDSDIHMVRCELHDPILLERALLDAAVVVNCIGFYVETRTQSFRDVHVTGARAIARTATSVGAKRLIHVSGIGVDRNSPSSYIRARAEGEDEVRHAFPAAAILRPSAMFSRSGAFFGDLDNIIRRVPVLPLFGDGRVRLQPVHARDVAKAVAKIPSSSGSRGCVYELGGPDVFTYREILQRLARRCGKGRVLLPVPYWFWRSIAATMTILPNPPITPAQVALMQRDNVVRDNVATFSDLAIDPQSAIAMGLV